MRSLFLLLFAPLCALNCERFETYGEALYWKPTGVTYDYASVQMSGGGVSAFTIIPDYHWGFRIGGQTDICSYGVALDGTYYHGRDGGQHLGSGATLTRQPALSNLINPRGRISTDYWNLQVSVRSLFLDNNRGSLSLLGAIRYATLKQKEVAEGRTEGGALNQIISTLTFRGAGPGIGLGGHYLLGCGFSAVGHGLWTALIGHRSTTWSVQQGALFLTRIPSQTVMAPGFEFRLGIEWGFNMNSTDWSFEAGYRLDHYWNAFNRPFFSDFARQYGRRVRSAGFGGPYATVRVGF